MKIILLFVGKTDRGYLATAIDDYLQRLTHYATVEVKIIPDLKNAKSLSEAQQREREGELLLQAAAGAELVLLDERGQQLTSEEFAAFWSKKMLDSTKTIMLAVGGAYGFSDDVYRHAAGKISLSRMTFTHQMVRLFLVEQIYRAFTVIRGEGYHH
jgi:23S rRNA (pseudouridine1915-N3)-methyltransferase